MPDVARKHERSSSDQQPNTYRALGVLIRPEDDARLDRALAGITEAERRAERETATLRVY